MVSGELEHISLKIETSLASEREIYKIEIEFISFQKRRLERRLNKKFLFLMKDLNGFIEVSCNFRCIFTQMIG